MKLIQFIRNGMLAIADSNIESRNYSYPKTGGFERDRQKLSGDMRQVGKDMKKVMDRHGSKQPYKRSGA